jgi:hypothetical protein
MRNSFLDRDAADAQHCDARMKALWYNLYGRFSYDLVSCLRVTGLDNRLFPHTDRRLHLLVAGLTPWEKEAYEKVQPLEQTSLTRWNV